VLVGVTFAPTGRNSRWRWRRCWEVAASAESEAVIEDGLVVVVCDWERIHIDYECGRRFLVIASYVHVDILIAIVGAEIVEAVELGDRNGVAMGDERWKPDWKVAAAAIHVFPDIFGLRVVLGHPYKVVVHRIIVVLYTVIGPEGIGVWIMVFIEALGYAESKMDVN
jgi:hypothetical protein